MDVTTASASLVAGTLAPNNRPEFARVARPTRKSEALLLAAQPGRLGRMSSVRIDLAEKLVTAGVASWLDPMLCSELEAYLARQLPWAGTHVAWDQIEGSLRLDSGSFTDGPIAGFVSRLAAVQNETVCVLFSRQLGLKFRSEWFLRHIDKAACNSEQFFAFASQDPSEAAESVAEFELGCTIWGMLPNRATRASHARLKLNVGHHEKSDRRSTSSYGF